MVFEEAGPVPWHLKTSTNCGDGGRVELLHFKKCQAQVSARKPLVKRYERLFGE